MFNIKLIYKGANNRTDLDLIRLGVMKVGESFIKDKVYDLPTDYATAMIKENSPNWEKAPVKNTPKKEKKE